jgi:hypothetical protein
LEYITALEENTASTIRATFDKLKAKLVSSTPSKGPDCAVVVLDDCEGWRYTYQALFMGQLRTSGNEKWKYYIGFEHELPSEEDLKTLKLIVFSGSG